MFTEVEISGYKGLKSVSLPGLKRICLVGGKNNTGKTSVLEALFFSLDWRSPDPFMKLSAWRGVERTQITPDSVWLPVFHQFSADGKIQVRSRDPNGSRNNYTAQLIGADLSIARQTSLPIETTNVKPDSAGLRVRQSVTKNSKTVFDSITSISGVPQLLESGPFSSKLIKSPEENPSPALFFLSRSRPSAAEDANFYGVLDQEKQTEILIESLKIFEKDLRGLSIIPVGGTPSLYADVEGISRKIPINFLGDGITKFLSLLLRISVVKGGYLFVDEIENGFHYSVMPLVWRALYAACKLHRVQLIATTHSYECLAAFAESLKDEATDDYSYLRLDSNGQGVTATPYDSASLRDATAGGWEVR